VILPHTHLKLVNVTTVIILTRDNLSIESLPRMYESNKPFQVPFSLELIGSSYFAVHFKNSFSFLIFFVMLKRAIALRSFRLQRFYGTASAQPKIHKEEILAVAREYPTLM
jgi:hypothetical protein